jgi:aryl-alcohol dehydrogenase-like predicted oxidoreductase
MEYRILGKTGLTVSAIGFGGAPIGIPNYLSRDDRDSATFRLQAIESIGAAVAHGINYFDTAPGYGEGRSERVMGEALAGHRDRVLLATKYTFQPGKESDFYTEQLRQSLARLRTDFVDVLQLHGGFFEDATAEAILTSGVLDWADAMRERGWCRHLGITAEGPSGALERLLRTGRFAVIEMAYNVIYQSACDYQRQPNGIIPLAKSLGMGVTTMRPTTCGVLQKLLTTEFPEIDTSRVTRLAINFVLSTPEVDSVIVGMRSTAEVAANVSLAEETGSRLDLRYLHDRFGKETP